jgi:hypothetical protein
MAYFKDYKITTPAQRVHRAPLRTIEELAEEFGVLVGQLDYAMRAAPIKHPPFQLYTGKKQWFVRKDMHLWWVAIGGKSFAVSDKADYHQKYVRPSKSSVTAHAQLTH